jgi:drug/metabolite transporter (DMT)-like permease
MTPARRAALLLTSTTVIWGSTFHTTQAAIQALVKAGATAEGATYLWMTARFGLAALAFAFVPGALRGLGRRELLSGLLITLPGVVGMAFQGFSLAGGSPTIIAFLTNTMVVFTPLFGFLFFRERVGRWLLVGVAMAVIGVWILTDPGAGKLGRPEAFALASAVVFGFQLHVVNARMKQGHPEATTLATFLHFTWIFALLTALLPAGRAALTRPVLEAFTRLPAAWLLPYLALAGAALSMWIWIRYQRDIAASRAAVIYCLEPVFAAMIGALFVREPFTWRIAAGGAVIIAANLFIELTAPPAPTAS